MGFYGNITNVNKSTFQFDKTYANRFEMDQSAPSDGVFVGRYVLVDYDEGSTIASLTQRIEEQYGIDIGDNNFAIGYKRMLYDGATGDYYEELDSHNQVMLQPSVSADADTPIYQFTDGDANSGNYVCAGSLIWVRGQVKIKTYAKYEAWDEAKIYVKGDKVDYNGKIYEAKEHSEANVGQIPDVNNSDFWTELSEANEIIYESELDLNVQDQLYQVVKATETVIDVIPGEEEGETEEVETQITYGKMVKLEDLEDYDVKKNYTANYTYDATKYSNIGRGWDSTVWQKTYKDGEYAYVMIAELNSVVPTFDIAVDAPTETPLKPHYDADNTNVYYKLHFQPTWGMRIKSANNGGTNTYSADEKIYPSDITGRYVVDSQVTPQITDTGINHHYIDKKVENVPLAVYFDKGSFSPYPDKEPQTTIYTDADGNIQEETTIDEIKLTPTGYSDNVYYAHETRENGSVVDNGTETAPVKYPDTYELSIMLPSIGQSVSQMWDIVYGPGAIKDNLNNYLWNKESYAFADEPTDIYIRNTDTRWNSLAGYRLSNESGVPVNDIEAMGSVATTINSVHDLMGMIIRETNDTENVAGWDPTKIYYKEGEGFYKKEKSYVYTSIEGELDKDIYKPVTLVDVTDGNYYRLDKAVSPIYDAEIESITEERAAALSDKPYNKYIKVNINDPVYDGAKYGTLNVGTVQPLESEYKAGELYYKTKIQDAVEGFALDIEPIPSNTDGKYYNIIATQLPEDEKFYYKDTYFVGVKREADQEWIDYIENESTTLTVDDFDQFRLCSEETYNDVLTTLEAAGLSTNQYRFFEGIKVTPNPSTSEWVEDTTDPILRRNLVLSALTENGYVKQDNGDYVREFKYSINDNGYAVYDFAYGAEVFTETIPAAYVNETAGTYSAPIYVCKINDEDPINELTGYTLLEILASQSSDYPYQVALEDGTFNQVFNLIRKPLPPTYNFEEASIVKLRAFDATKDYYFYLHDEDGVNGEGSFVNQWGKHRYWVKEDPAGFETDQGKQRLEANDYFTLEIDDTIAYYYTPELGLYYKDLADNYIKEMAVRIKPITQLETINGEANEEYRPYYLESGLGWSEIINKPFIPNKYYYCIEEDITDYDGVKHYELATEMHDVMYEKDAIYVMESQYDLVPVGSEWNLAVDPVPEGVVLAKRAETWVAKPLPEFAQLFNTLHGQLLNVNNVLKQNDFLTRDQNTVQGSINVLNDIIAKFDTLKPAEIVMVDTYGRIHSADWDTIQKSSTAVGAAPAIPDGEAESADNERWIKLTTTSGNATDFKPHIKIEHMFKAGEDNPITTNLNTDNVESENDSDKLVLYTPILDNMGHVVAKQENTVTLPYGFKTITTNGRESNDNATDLDTQNDIVAENTQDTLGINSGNEWIKIETDADSDVITISHDVKNTSSTTSALNLSSETEGSITFNIPTYAFDATNHYASHDTKTLTMPNSYGKFIGDTGESEANVTHDTFSITGDTWVTSTVSNDAITLAHSAPHEVAERNVANIKPNFGETFTVEDWRFDDKGHKYGVETHTVTIPKGSLTVNEGIDGANVVTSLQFTDTTGALVATNKLVGALALTGYSSKTSIDTMPIATDSINDAIGKLAYVLDNDTKQVNTRISEAIAALGTTISQAAGADGLTLSITEANGVITTLSGSIAANTYDVYGSASAAQANAESHANTVATMAETNAKAYADGLASNYEAAGAINTALTTETFGDDSLTIAQMAAKIAELEQRIATLEGGE